MALANKFKSFNVAFYNFVSLRTCFMVDANTLDRIHSTRRHGPRPTAPVSGPRKTHPLILGPAAFANILQTAEWLESPMHKVGNERIHSVGEAYASFANGQLSVCVLQTLVILSQTARLRKNNRRL